MSAAAAGAFPKWVMLEPYLFRKDDDKSFPDDTKAPIKASGTTDWGADFRIAFSLAKPPQISCLYARMPGFPGPDKEEPLAMLATHRQLALLVVFTKKSLLKNFFIFRANKDKPCSSSLTVLPPCTLPPFDYSRGDFRLPARPSSPSRDHPDPPCLLDMTSLGLWCGGDDKEEEFVVAELTPYVPSIGRMCIKAFADIRLLRSSTTDVQLGSRKWEPLRVPIPSITNNDDLRKLSCWQTDAVVPFQRWLCWVDYHQGILFCDLSNKDEICVSFLWLPLDLDSSKKPCRDVDTITSDDVGDTRIDDDVEPTCNIYYGGVSIVDHGRLLKFVYVRRYDGLDYGALKPGTGFTVTCHTLVLGGGGMGWKKDDYTVTSDELPEYLQCGGVPIFPQVDIERPHVVHFLFLEFGKAYEKMSLLSIDMSTKTVESFYLYMDGNEYLRSGDNDCLQGRDADFVTTKSLSRASTPFLPCEFPRFCCQPENPTIGSKRPLATEKKNGQSSDESDDISDESDKEHPQKNPKVKPEVSECESIKQAKTPKTNSAQNEAKTPTKNQSQTTGSKTIFVGNLSYRIEREQVKQFFEEAGEVVDVRLSTFEDGSFKGYGHVEFAIAEAAQKPLGIANPDLMGQPVWVKPALERGAYTSGSGRHNSCFKSAPRYNSSFKSAPRSTVYIEGFDTSIGEDQIRMALEEHFGSCGEITRVSIPKDYETGACKGIAFMDFKDPDSLDKAYELNASELGGYLLYVDQAKPRPGNNRDGGFRGDRRGSFGGRGGSGRGRGGGRGRGFGGRGGRGDR